MVMIMKIQERNMVSNEKVLLAYSGGLDTSVILKWLLLKGYRVSCFVADVGQQRSAG